MAYCSKKYVEKFLAKLDFGAENYKDDLFNNYTKLEYCTLYERGF
jgi:hypothetical protein